jgi:hypothetical protein
MILTWSLVKVIDATYLSPHLQILIPGAGAPLL